jgi:adenylosuccinate synthase
MVDVLLGLQWGDEGKGKIVDFLAKDYNIIARFQGGPNAGHTLYIHDKKVVLHTIPSGVFHGHILNVIGNGVVLDPVTFKKEFDNIASHGIDLKYNLYISHKAHLILPTHKALDKASELSKGEQKIGSTLKGIGPTYTDKTARNGLRVGDILKPNFKEAYEQVKQKHNHILKSMYGFTEDISEWENDFFASLDTLKQCNIINLEYWINNKIKEKQKILAEGAQGSMLDVDFGTYPFVTSSNTTIAGVCSGLGVPATAVNKVIGITKAYCTRVGGGPFPTELNDDIGKKLQTLGNEFGATTGRPRRCGWIDMVALKYACMVNGVDTLIITKADVLDTFEDIFACIAYNIDGVETSEFPYDVANIQITPVLKELRGWQRNIGGAKDLYTTPAELIKFVDFIEEQTGARVKYISNGVGREQLIKL